MDRDSCIVVTATILGAVVSAFLLGLWPGLWKALAVFVFTAIAIGVVWTGRE